MKFDELFVYVGEMGLYQWLVFTVTSLYLFFVADASRVVFTARSMPHWCKIDELKNLPFEQQKYIGIPESTPGKYSKCEKYEFNYSSFTLNDFLTWNRTLMLKSDTSATKCDGWVYDRSQFASTAVSKYDLVCSDAHFVSLISTFFMLGFLVGSLVPGPIADKIGRRPTMLIFSLVKLVGVFMTAFAPNFAVQAVSQVFLGAGTYGGFLASYILLMEQVGSKHRTLCNALQGVFGFIGMCTMSGMAYLIRDFFQLSMAFGMLSFIPVFFWFIIPESPRWLLVKGRYKEAEINIRHLAAVNRRDLPKDFDIMKVQANKAERKRGTARDIFRSPEMRKTTIILLCYWFTDVLVFYALSLNVEALYGDLFVNYVLMGLVDLVGDFLAMPLLNGRVTGRRLTTGLSMVFTGLCCLARVGLLLTGQGLADTIVFMVGRAFISISFTAIYVYSAELFPTEVRTTGLGFASFVGRIGGLGAGYAGGPLATVWQPLPLIIFATLSLVSGFLVLSLTETLGHDMLDTIQEAKIFFSKKGKSKSVQVEENEKTTMSEVESPICDNGSIRATHFSSTGEDITKISGSGVPHDGTTMRSTGSYNEGFVVESGKFEEYCTRL